jgi:hypothetical protein
MKEKKLFNICSFKKDRKAFKSLQIQQTSENAIRQIGFDVSA